MAVTVKLSDAAKAEFVALPAAIKGRINSVFARLVMWPAVSGAKPMRGSLQGSYRVRTGDYRVIFTVVGDTLTVTRVGIRRDVYED